MACTAALSHSLRYHPTGYFMITAPANDELRDVRLEALQRFGPRSKLMKGAAKVITNKYHHLHAAIELSGETAMDVVSDLDSDAESETGHQAAQDEAYEQRRAPALFQRLIRDACEPMEVDDDGGPADSDDENDEPLQEERTDLAPLLAGIGDDVVGVF
jgi:Mg-chelatase subunit ChlI